VCAQAPLSSSTPQGQKNGANGSSLVGKGSAKGAKGAKGKGATAGSVDVQRNTLAAGEAAQVEHVTLKKKPRCTCCIIQ